MRSHRNCSTALAVCLLPAALAACQAPTGSQNGGEAPPGEFTGLRTFAGKCVYTKPATESATGLAAAVIPTLIGEGFNLVQGLLKEASEDKSVSVQAASTNILASTDEAPACVQVVRGSFALKPPKVSDAGWAKALGLGKTHVTSLLQQRIYLTRRPELFFEGELKRVPGGTTFAVAPRYFTLQEPAEGGLAWTRNRSVLIAFAVTGPDKSPDPGKAPGTEVAFGEVTAGTVLKVDDPVHCNGNAEDAAGDCEESPLPGRAQSTGDASGSDAEAGNKKTSSDDTEAKDGNHANPYHTDIGESRWFTFGEIGAERKPYVLTAAVTETRSGSALAGVLYRVLSATRPKLEEAANSLLTPKTGAERLAEKLAELEEEARLVAAADTALQSALSALEACSHVSEDQTGLTSLERIANFEKAKAARRAQDTANRAALAAGMVQPFASGSLVTTSEVRRKCEKSLNNHLGGTSKEGANAGS